MTGDDIDPRFTLANERTFLAWIRTSLGLLAAAAGLLAIDLPWPSVVERGLALLLAAAAGVSGLIAWYRWRQVERAIAEGRVAPPPRAHVVLVLVVGFVAGAVIVMTLID